MLQIKGFHEVTMMDWDGVVASILFVGGCNFRCLYCHNYNIAFNPDRQESIPYEVLFKRLYELKGWVDGVIISGGEPTIYGESLISFLEKLKADGFKTKLYTNGANPSLLIKLIEENLLDAVSMDIKHLFSKYNLITTLETDAMIEKVKQSVSILKSNEKLSVKFRLTVVKGLHTKDDVKEICELVFPKPLILQNVSAEHVPENFVNLIQPFTAAEFEQLQKSIN